MLKKDGGRGAFGSFRSSLGGHARDSVLSHGGRNSYTSRGRFSSKYGDNRLYLQRLSRNSIDSSQGLQGGEAGGQEFKMKIRPKPRKYDREDLDESYFAANSNDGNISRDDLSQADTGPTDKSDYVYASKRDFKIFDKKHTNKNYASNEIRTSRYTMGNFIPQNLIE